MARAAPLRLALVATGALLVSACDAPEPMSGPTPASSDEAAALKDATAMLDERPAPDAEPDAYPAPAP